MSRKSNKARNYLRARDVPPRVVSAGQLTRMSEESGSSFHGAVQRVAKLLQAGSGLGPAPHIRGMIERGAIKP